MKLIFFSIFFVIIFQLNAQISLDSLLNVYNSTKDDDAKIELLDELSSEASQISIDSGVFYKKQLVKILEDKKDYKNIVSKLHELASLYLRNNNKDSAVITYNSAIFYAKQSGDAELLGLVYHKCGNGYLFNQQNDSAITYYLEALQIRDSIQDTSGLAATTNNIGYIYFKLKQFDLALDYYSQSLKYEIMDSNEAGIASSYNNIGTAFWKQNKLDSALFYIKKSLDIRIKIGARQSVLKNNYTNLGVIYRSKEEYDSAAFYFERVIPICKRVNNSQDLANAYNNLATTYMHMNGQDLALKYLDSAKVILVQLNNYELLKNLYGVYSSIYSGKEDYEMAYIYMTKYVSYSDSLYNENFANQINEMQAKYESEKKEKEIELQNLQLDKKDLEIKTQRKILIGFIAFLLVVIILSAFLARLYFQKKKANSLLQQKNAEIFQQKEEIETQANNLNEAFIKIKEVNEKLEEQKTVLKEKNEFVESSIKYASTIQNASLPEQAEIDKHFDNFIIYLPKDIVSGDFYFFSKVKNSLFFVVSDCTGHGVPGAFMSMIGIRLLNKYINEYKIESPAEILDNLNKDVVKSLKQNENKGHDGMDMIICKFSETDDNKFNLVYAGAKRPLYYHSFEQNDVVKIKGTRKSIGGINQNIETKFIDNNIKISKKDTIYMFSDGLQDQNNIDRKKFGTSRLMNILKNNADKSLDEQNLILLSDLENWQKDTVQRDDITFVALKLKEI